MPTLFIPSLLRDLTGNVDHVDLPLPNGEERASVRSLLGELERRYPGVEERLLHEGDIMPGIAVFVNGEQTRLGLREKVPADCEIHFIPPTVGG
jgi:molybdopterin converting factor small subunit